MDAAFKVDPNSRLETLPNPSKPTQTVNQDESSMCYMMLHVFGIVILSDALFRFSTRHPNSKILNVAFTKGTANGVENWPESGSSALEGSFGQRSCC